MKDLSHSQEPVLKLRDDAYLRPIGPDDVTIDYVNGLNDTRVNKFLIGPSACKQTEKLVKEFVAGNFEASDAQLFGLYIGGKLCGTLRLHDIADEMAFIGLAIFKPEQWGQGWGARMIQAVSDYALKELGVQTVRAGIDAFNVASQRTFIKAGFVHLSELDQKGDQKTSQVWERKV